MTPEELKFAAEYHRGYEDGQAVKAADQWQLDRERAKVIEAVKKVVPEGYFGSHNMLSEICRAIYSPVFGWTAEAGRDLCDRLIHLLGDDDETASNDDRTCPIAVQSPSITDELRDWVANHYSGWSSKQADGFAIADRIDEQFNRICLQQEAVLQRTISETIDEHKCEMDELRADYEQAISDITGVERGEGSDLLMPVDVYLHVRDGLRHDVEMWRDRAEDMRMERDDLRAELRVANQTHECNRKLAKRNEQWCDALLDLIRDAASEYQTAASVAHRLQERVFKLRCERDELQSKLQAISVLCERDDG